MISAEIKVCEIFLDDFFITAKGVESFFHIKTMRIDYVGMGVSGFGGKPTQARPRWRSRVTSVLKSCVSSTSQFTNSLIVSTTSDEISSRNPSNLSL